LRSQFLGLSLSLLLAACSGNRSAAPKPTPPFDGLVLVIQETPEGHLRYSWQQAVEFAPPLDGSLSTLDSASHGIVLASRRPRDCDQEHIDCYQQCMKRRPPYRYAPRGSHTHIRHCTTTCLEEYMECLETQKHQALRFPAVDDLMEWLKRHRKELLVGSVVVIAGVAFVVVSAGAGLFVLAPVVLVASSETTCEPRLAGG
jgi:hypothetical protein